MRAGIDSSSNGKERPSRLPGRRDAHAEAQVDVAGHRRRGGGDVVRGGRDVVPVGAVARRARRVRAPCVGRAGAGGEARAEVVRAAPQGGVRFAVVEDRSRTAHRPARDVGLRGGEVGSAEGRREVDAATRRRGAHVRGQEGTEGQRRSAAPRRVDARAGAEDERPACAPGLVAALWSRARACQ